MLRVQSVKQPRIGEPMRVIPPLQRTQKPAKCAVCGRTVRASDAVLRVRGVEFHSSCAGYQSR